MICTWWFYWNIKIEWYAIGSDLELLTPERLQRSLQSTLQQIMVLKVDKIPVFLINILL